MLLNNAVCFSYLVIELVSDILDKASYNRDKFILPVTIVSKEIVKKSMFDSGKPLVKATDWWRSAYPTLWYRDLSELWSHMYGKLKEKRSQCRCYSARKQFEDFLWISLWSPRPCCFSPGFLWVKINVTVQTDIQKNKSKNYH